LFIPPSPSTKNNFSSSWTPFSKEWCTTSYKTCYWHWNVVCLIVICLLKLWCCKKIHLTFFVTMTIFNSFAAYCSLVYFYGCECYWTSYMSCKWCNSLYVKLFTYATCVKHLQLCRNNYSATLL
jgi:hypothetical protein